LRVVNRPSMETQSQKVMRFRFIILLGNVILQFCDVLHCYALGGLNGVPKGHERRLR
jgi:hypothetical protein